MHRLSLLVVLAGCPRSGPSDVTADAAAIESAPDASLTATSATSDWHTQVIYLALADRFRNGDTTNDNATHCYDPTNPQKFHGGDFAGLRQNLAYLQDVGATAVWITPPNRQAGPAGQCGYHGYWIDYTDPDDAAIEPELGTAADLQNLVGDMHAANMKLVLDMVVNHAGDTARIPAEHPTWFHNPATCAQLGSPTVYCPVDNHPDFAQENPEVAAYLSALEARTVTRYQIDGIRMDTAMHVPAAYFHDSFFPAVRAAANVPLFTVAEIFQEDSTSSFVPYLDAGFDSAFHYPLYGALVAGIGQAGSVDAVAQAVASGISTLGADRANDLVLFVDDHDVVRFANLPGYGVSEDEIRRRLMLGLDLIFTLPGIPLLYYGDELGMYGAADPDNRRDLPAWASDPAGRAQPHAGVAVAGSASVYTRVQTLSKLRRTLPSLATGDYQELWRQNGAAHPNVFAFSRGHAAAMIITIVNNGAASATVQIPTHELADGTMLVDALGDGAPPTLPIAASKLAITLPGKSAAIYRVSP